MKDYACRPLRSAARAPESAARAPPIPGARTHPRTLTAFEHAYVHVAAMAAALSAVSRGNRIAARSTGGGWVEGKKGG